MAPILSHIVQKRYPGQYEDIATDALAYIVTASDAARDGLLTVLRGLIADLPNLRFRTQHAQEDVRPDMWGYDAGGLPRVLVEVKFWAGLTQNQPVGYLRSLATHEQPTILLFVVPASRSEALWRQLGRRLVAEGVAFSVCQPPTDILYAVRADAGPLVALTSWSRLLRTLEIAIDDDHKAAADLEQLRGLCDEADRSAFLPFAPETLSDQRIPSLLWQLDQIVIDVVQSAVTRGILDIQGLRPVHSREFSGRYVAFRTAGGVGAFFGVHYGLWRNHAPTPLWLTFSFTKWGRGDEVRKELEPWAERNGIPHAHLMDRFALGIDLPTGEERDQVTEEVTRFLTEVACVLAAHLKPTHIAS